jgi:hypothetical protein
MTLTKGPADRRSVSANVNLAAEGLAACTLLNLPMTGGLAAV